MGAAFDTKIVTYVHTYAIIAESSSGLFVFIETGRMAILIDF